MNQKIGIIGFGNMGSAIAYQLKDDYQIFVFEKEKSKTKNAALISVADDILKLINEVDIVILAVKPQDFDSLLSGIKGRVKDKLIISIAAGISTEHIEKILGQVRVVRVMPNMPAKIGEGVSCLSKGRFTALNDLDFTENIFDYLGETIVIEEKMMDSATAISGSGPGYFFDLIQAKNITINNFDQVRNFAHDFFVPELTRAAQSVGFSPEEARFLAAATGNGCIGLLKKTSLSPSDLVKQVSSKGGTTEAGLLVLHKGGSLEDAAKAALQRAKELSGI